MAISKKMLTTFVLTILLAVSFVHCSDRTSGVGINQEYAKCYDLADCQKPKVDDAACESLRRNNLITDMYPVDK
ncbi:unnamed protein product [Arabidopsis thaliana]|uniref:Uncharacterized protein n=1 Tax=Arabidopsis thaliana TaxID=3702 RepID=A0A5S9WXR3_ARATH|nr:unnamed protein product [Arabidopsis thaliana]